MHRFREYELAANYSLISQRDALAIIFLKKIYLIPNEFILSEETSRHIVQVLRMQEGGHLLSLTVKDKCLLSKLFNANKKNAEVKIIHKEIC